MGFSDGNCRVVLLLDRSLHFARGVLRGVRSYAAGKTNWILRDAPPSPKMMKLVADWEPAGIIAGLSTAALARAVKQLRIPVVDTATVLPRLGLPTVDVDPIGVGRLAAEYFLDKQYRNFGFFGSHVAVYARLQEQGFRQRLAKAGYEAQSCYYEYLPEYTARMLWREVTSRIIQWLDRLPKPVAIFCCEDILSRLLADTCRQLNLRVPEEVALLGCGNDELECTLTEPTLSSIAVPAERVGYEAAALLDALLEGQKPPDRPVFLPPISVVTRHSTDVSAIDDQIVRQAVRFIRENATRHIRVKDIAEALAVSRRLLERRFRALLGRSVLQEIYRVRIEHAKRLLAQSHLPVGAVAFRSGFSSPRHLDVRFRQLTGLTPRAFRRQFQLP
ncbi:MAG: DNA-binding transcriptional regulator [Thermoguttaceae bacterium]|nr:DNA-binding transcriptional regulator [Thermoguttaceae bacterium]MDW8078526.1 DNA-binding transcriptional regulator [Thermoguttaceae bacterium]